MQGQKILLVEDDEKIARLTKAGLEKWQFQTTVVQDFQHVLAEFQQLQPQLVILDISLPFYSGYHWCQEIRKHSTVPIIFLSSASDKMNMLMAMNLGADDFIAKPFDLELLVAKIQATFRRTYQFNQQEQLLVYRELSLSLVEHELYYQQQVISLTPNETKLLSQLFLHAEQKVTKEELMEKLWESEEFISKNTLTVNMTRLRKKLADAGLSHTIQTLKGIGYMLVMPDGK
ncbi:response regulator transcription factor [Enterococcus olivae]